MASRPAASYTPALLTEDVQPTVPGDGGGHEALDLGGLGHAVLVERFSDPRRPAGCLQTNTVLETPAAGETITRQIVTTVDGLEPLFYQVLCRAQTLSQLRPGQDPLALAQFLATLVLGLGVLGKRAGSPAALRNAATIALSVFAA